MTYHWLRPLPILAALIVASPPAQAFDHTHTLWNALLKQHVKWDPTRTATQVDYAGFQKNRSRLKQYLDQLSGISPDTFESWSKPEQLAFLINAYNAFTVELILTKYPDLKSIKDTGTIFSSPWKKEFFVLLGKRHHLDWIEHDMIRKPGTYDDPRIHMAVNCASVGCPALRDEAFMPESLDDQLEDGVRRFLADRSRNRYAPRSGRLEVSKIFDWYGEDFKKGYRGIDSLETLFARYADLLADRMEDRERIRSKVVKIDFLDYNWNLNDAL